MSSGVTHTKACMMLSSAFVVAGIFYGEAELYKCAIGSMAGIMLSGDLDVDAGNVSNKIIRNKMGRSFERIWRWYWKPYSTSFKHGRFASHFPVFSTFVRLAYIYFMLIIPFYLVYSLIGYLPNFKVDLMYELYYWAKVFLHPPFFIGLATSDLFHYALDVLTTNGE